VSCAVSTARLSRTSALQLPAQTNRTPPQVGMRPVHSDGSRVVRVIAYAT
jgi:hypothetical protein